MNIAAYMLSCPAREEMRQRTLANLRASDWNDPVHIEIDRTTFERRQERQERTALRMLQRALEDGPELILFLEDDLDFNRYISHNLKNWYPLQQLSEDGHFFASLYNPRIREAERDGQLRFFIAEPSAVYGSQAFLLSRATAQHIADRWETQVGMQDIKMSRLAGPLTPIYYHQPSLVQHIGVQSAWGGPYHKADDFQKEWKAVINGNRVSHDMIVAEMKKVEGWLDDCEARLLVDTAISASASPDCAIVEVGSYCGKSTVVFGLVLKQLGTLNSRVYAVDPHDGRISALDGSITATSPTLKRFRANLATAGVSSLVEPIVAEAPNVSWTRAIDLLFVDGLHDYPNVSADFKHFAPFLKPKGMVAFHDCAPYFPGVQRLVGELLQSRQYEEVAQSKSLMVLKRAA